MRVGSGMATGCQSQGDAGRRLASQEPHELEFAGPLVPEEQVPAVLSLLAVREVVEGDGAVHDVRDRQPGPVPGARLGRRRLAG